MRLRRTLLGGLLTLAFMAISIVVTQLGLLDKKFYQMSYMLIWFSVFIGFGVWIGLRWNTVFCPRCGWNIFFLKPMPTVAFVIPSACPNCGFDLENSDADAGLSPNHS